ncbi:enoyl-CoA hydratase/isomerase family protein [Duganella dendranthematis]|jgi:enoyl-CoA hydratase/carnithine racemase|uniref:Enoyl-CoA hydratase/isomerase family protein n=1 Tax=Duganella dendranthematis TaxID=2728021 RepID=A0ABX6M9P1_9BURK|nr:enoyl-CoA hydratase/isomerase family protein [Duganella dendranthematis]QJD91033.1 enoyl-CoA hydratase/isomerase family protein [Duganella dendranthematis]
MSEYIHTSVSNGTGLIVLDRPKALNSLSLEMVRAITRALRCWRDDDSVAAVLVRSSSEKAFCAGGDIRFFHDVGRATPQGGSALLEDFFTEEYSLNHLVHFYPKPYIALMDGVVMGGGMGIAQGGVRIVTDKTKMAMPEVNIGLFPDVGGSYFLSRAPGALGYYLGVTGVTINAADALYAGLADHYAPLADRAELEKLLAATPGAQLRDAIATYAAAHDAGASALAADRAAIDQHFSAGSVPAIIASLQADSSEFAAKTLQVMTTRSPLMMSVTHELIKRGAALDVAGCLRMERTLVRHNFENGEVIEGVRALVIDKDNAPQWQPATLAEVTSEMVQRFFQPVWPDYAHPLRRL